jgi:hypothetical protein
MEGKLIMARESLDAVEQMMVDDYREKHQDNEELRSFSDREILQMCAPTVHDYKIYYERLITSLLAEKEAREKEVEGLRANYNSFFQWQQRDEIGKELREDIANEEQKIRELETRIAAVKKEKKARMAKFYRPKSSHR